MEFDATKVVQQKQAPLKNRATKKRYARLDKKMVIQGKTEEGYIKVQYGSKRSFMDIVTVKKYDIDLMDDETFYRTTDAYWEFMKNYPHPIKEVFLNFNEDNQLQQAYFTEKIKKSKNARQTELLEVELDKLQHLERTLRRNDVYMFVYAPTVEALEHRKETIRMKFSDTLMQDDIDLDTKTRILATMMNGEAPRKEIRDEISFLEAIQPQGNISFKNEFHIRTGHSYQTCLHVYGYPSVYMGNWMKDVTNHDELLPKSGEAKNATFVPRMDTIVTVDYMTETEADFGEMLKGTVGEYISQYNRAQDATEKDNLYEEVSAARDLAFKVNNAGEQIKMCHVRIYISASTQVDLEKHTDNIRRKLSNKGYQSAIYLEENLEEWQSLFLGYDLQKALPSFHPGNEIPAEAMGLGFAHNQTFLKDPTGPYLGFTRTGGTVYWDLFHKSEKRLAYNLFIAGDMGAGKSTALKKLVKSNAMKGNFIRGFDKAGEFAHIVSDIGGHSIKLNGEDGRLNLFQVYPNVSKKDVDGRFIVDEEQSFSQHVKNLGMVYQLKNGLVDAGDLDDITSLAYDFYQTFGLWGDGQASITNLPETAYPILEDWVAFIDQKMVGEIDTETKTAYRRIYKAFKAMLTNYGKMFNGHTTIPNFSKQPILFYETGGMETLDDYVFDIQIYLATTQIWATMTTLGRQEQNAYTAREKHWFDYTRFLVVMDECHNYLNIEKAYTAKFFVTMLSEARKFFAGIVFATQRLDRMFPKAANVQSKEMVVASNQLNQIVGLCPYKMIFKTDIAAMNQVKSVFKTQLTESEYELIPSFHKGDCILSMAGDQNLTMHVEITKEEDLQFAGGA
ncbi:TraE, Type IV secretion system protein [Listeria monocytogenes]|nr:TraE, Type IV secretion system protein [Listeria monocytogenes]EAC5024900.1 TraE, Type IV secretion system protein [Listeria monocytogenes]EAC6063020.1 TraE, Type IV secretion system protein [Listeria monocytogenes]EAC6175314.1 TraE, Type IV secretion system protein [Listeria monocytogenes]EAC8844294.1 TraE, Type IV secretion system protein [Listeria monocytogenes]